MRLLDAEFGHEPLQLLQAWTVASDLEPQRWSLLRRDCGRADQVGDVLLRTEPGHGDDRPARTGARKGEPLHVDAVEDRQQSGRGDPFGDALGLHVVRDADVPIDQPCQLTPDRDLSRREVAVPPVAGVDHQRHPRRPAAGPA